MPNVQELIAGAIEHQMAGRLPEAEELYRRIVAVEPAHAEVWQQLGLIAFVQNQFEASCDALSNAIRIDGRVASYHHNLGATCRAMGRLADAERSYRRAIQLEPNHLCAQGHLWQVLKAVGRDEEADVLLPRVLAAEPRTPDEHALVGTILLSLGQFRRGWAEHEHRFDVPLSDARNSDLPRWDGSPLAGRTLLVTSEQGLGDTLQMVRYLKVLEARGSRAVLAGPPQLVPLLRGSGHEVVPQGEVAPKAKLTIPLFSLPHVLGTTVETIPAQVPYLSVHDSIVAEWRNRLAHCSGFRVGICWQGNPFQRLDRTRSIKLAEFAPLASVVGVTLLSLQHGYGVEQIGAARSEFPLQVLEGDVDEGRGTFVDTAAVMMNLDLIITCDTSIAHLAGALGRPVWVALSSLPDWRWMYGREDSPWYPTMRLFRQRKFGDWSAVFREMGRELTQGH